MSAVTKFATLALAAGLAAAGCGSSGAGRVDAGGGAAGSPASGPAGFTTVQAETELSRGQAYLDPPDAARASPAHNAADVLSVIDRSGIPYGREVTPTVRYGLFVDKVHLDPTGKTAAPLPAFVATYSGFACAPSGPSGVVVPGAADVPSAPATAARTCVAHVVVTDDGLRVLGSYENSVS